MLKIRKKKLKKRIYYFSILFDVTHHHFCFLRW